jgi:hypothetical protein
LHSCFTAGSRRKRLETPEKEEREAESHGAERQPCRHGSSERYASTHRGSDRGRIAAATDRRTTGELIYPTGGEVDRTGFECDCLSVDLDLLGDGRELRRRSRRALVSVELDAVARVNRRA